MPDGCHLIDRNGTTTSLPGGDQLRARLEQAEFFWLDLHRPSRDDIELLREVFSFHPLALEDAEHFGQRPKLDPYDQFALLVIYGAAPDDDRLVEVHCFYAAGYLVTVHHDECPAFVELRDRYARRGSPIDQGALLLYRVADALVDSFFPVLSDLDDRIDTLEDAIFRHPSDDQLQEIFAMKRLLVGLRKAITPQRDLFARLATDTSPLPGLTEEGERYFRDVYDHLIRISDLVDSYRDLLSGAMDVYLSTVSNRLNAVMKQLAVIATIFLPLSFITGFFGQNFAYLIRNVTGGSTFLLLGLGTQLATLVALLIFFRRRGWF